MLLALAGSMVYRRDCPASSVLLPTFLSSPSISSCLSFLVWISPPLPLSSCFSLFPFSFSNPQGWCQVFISLTELFYRPHPLTKPSIPRSSVGCTLSLLLGSVQLPTKPCADRSCRERWTWTSCEMMASECCLGQAAQSHWARWGQEACGDAGGRGGWSIERVRQSGATFQGPAKAREAA